MTDPILLDERRFPSSRMARSDPKCFDWPEHRYDWMWLVSAKRLVCPHCHGRPSK